MQDNDDEEDEEIEQASPEIVEDDQFVDLDHAKGFGLENQFEPNFEQNKPSGANSEVKHRSTRYEITDNEEIDINEIELRADETLETEESKSEL